MSNDTLKTAIEQAIEYAEKQGADIPLDVRVEAIKFGIIKTYEFYLNTLLRLVRSVYNNTLGGEFIDIMANLIQGQLTDAWNKALADNGAEMIEDMQALLNDYILSEYEHVDQFYRDIVDARVDGTPLEPLLSRAELWANRYNDVYNAAVIYLTEQMGGKLEWQYGDTEHCETCLSLNGVVAFASEWEEAGIRPQSPPNDLLECGGWKCQCSLTPTDKRRSPKALDTLMNIAVARGL